MSISIRSYYHGQANAMQVSTANITYWFSYQTVIAFQNSSGTYVSENDWGPTTGKHLNEIDGGDKKSRLSRSDFEKKLTEAENR